MHRLVRIAPVLAVVASLAACTRDEAPAAAPASPEAAATPPPETRGAPKTDAWVGRWTGPEGTFLLVEGSAAAGYRVTVQDLDGPKTYDGRTAGDHLRFERDGAEQAIRATDGAGTGMKWLAEKRDCLVITPGAEGFCRD